MPAAAGSLSRPNGKARENTHLTQRLRFASRIQPLLVPSVRISNLHANHFRWTRGVVDGLRFVGIRGVFRVRAMRCMRGESCGRSLSRLRARRAFRFETYGCIHRISGAIARDLVWEASAGTPICRRASQSWSVIGVQSHASATSKAMFAITICLGNAVAIPSLNAPIIEVH